MRVVIIGNGIAGNSAGSVIRKLDNQAEIMIISDEEHPHYSACVLPAYIAGELPRERVFIKTPQEYRATGIATRFGQNVLEIDAQNKRLMLARDTLSYDILVLATGSKPVVPPIPGSHNRGVFCLKSLADADRIAAESTGKAVIIGSGLIGVEAAIALHKKGWQVSMVELLDWILPRVFDREPSLLLEKELEGRVEVFTGERVIRICGEGEVTGIITDKREIDCNMVIMAIGMTPEVELASRAGIGIGHLGGIKTDQRMLTDAQDIYACGDCAQNLDAVTGQPSLSLLWPSARQQGDVVGYNCCGIKRKYSGSMNITGIEVFGTHALSVGHTYGTFRDGKLAVIERADGYYSRLLMADGKLVGAQFVGHTDDVGPLVAAVKNRANLDRLERLVAMAEICPNPLSFKIRPYLV